MRARENINQGENEGVTMRPNFDDYDHIVFAFSGGKDSLACLLHTLDLRDGDKEKIEIWHHDVDGHGERFMDWAVTTDYCRSIARAFDVPFYLSWKVGGFKREMLRDNARTAPTSFETPNGIMTVGGTRGKESTRLKFPQVSPDLKVRWCSAYLKIDICISAIRNQERFNNSKTLLITGERAEESANRARYKTFEPHKSDNRNGKSGRHVDHWRPVHAWTEAEVWEIIERYKVNPHPAYKIGWGRVSCAACIFGSKNQWASLNKIMPDQVKTIADYEQAFGITINRNKSVTELIEDGTPYEGTNNGSVPQAIASKYYEPVYVDNWTMPAGAFGESCGPV